LIKLHLTLSELGPHRRIPQFARSRQEVTERFYNLLAVAKDGRCLKWVNRYRFGQ
jgi:hypothetical protein